MANDLDAAIRARLDEWQQFRRQDGAIAEGYGYDEMAAAIVAVLDRHRAVEEGFTHVDETAYEVARRWALEETVRAIAEKLGVEVTK